MTTRAEHLAWCKARALEALEAGGCTDAVASMISDLGKWSAPLYDEAVLGKLRMDGMLFRKTPEQVRAWIGGLR